VIDEFEPVDRVRGTTHSTGHVPTQDKRPATIHQEQTTRLHLAARRRSTFTVQPLLKGCVDHERLRSVQGKTPTSGIVLDDLIQSKATGDFYKKQTTTTRPRTYIKCGGHSNVSFDGSLVTDLFKLNKPTVVVRRCESAYCQGMPYVMMTY